MGIDSSKKPLRVGVLGAGPAGLTIANALERYGGAAVEVSIIDKNSTVSDYEGVEYGIQDRACFAFERIGIKDDVLRRANPLATFRFFDERRNKMQFMVPVDPKYCFEVHRHDFLADLEAQLRNVDMCRKQLVTGLSFKDSGEVKVLTQSRSEDEDASRELVFDVVIACEGLRSPTRQQLFPEEFKINEYDFHILYMLVEAKDGQDMPEHFREIANGSFFQFNMGRLATNMFFPLGRDRIAIAISFNRETQQKIYADLGVDQSKTWSDLDSETKKKIATVFAKDTKVYDDLFTKLIDLVPDWQSKGIYSWSMRDSDPLKVPYSSEGNVILIGDACHALLPCIGQGASLAIEDGEILGRYLADFARTEWKPETLKADLTQRVFAPFAKVRAPVWADVMGRARAALPNFKSQQTTTGFAISPYVPIKIVSYLFAFAEWIREWIGRRPFQ